MTTALLLGPGIAADPVRALLCLLPVAAARAGIAAVWRWSAAAPVALLLDASIAVITGGGEAPMLPEVLSWLAVAVASAMLALLAARNVDLAGREARRLAGELRDGARLLRAAESRRQDFLTNLSHELRTPLAGALGMTEILLRQDPTPGQMRHLHLIQESLRGLVGVVSDLLDFGEAASGRLELDLRRTDLRTLTEQTIGMFAPRAVAKGLELRYQIDERLPTSLWVDPDRFRQIVVNLLSNALKFTERGTVELRLDWHDDERLSLEVEDTGIGIAASEQAKIFTPFEQVDTSTSRRFGGSGLGLAICRGVVDLMSGAIELDSRRGEGSTFRVELPLRRAERDPTTETAPLGRLDGRCILVVEDDEVNRVVVTAKLESLQVEVEQATGGREALEILGRRSVDAILMDCQMPEIDGYELSRRVRREPGPNAETPILALTAHSHPDERKRCLAAGMNDYLTKPVTTSDLEQMLARWIFARRMPETSGAIEAAIVETVRRGL